MFETKTPHPTLPDVVDVSPTELWERLRGVHVVDVRRPDEFAGELGRVPGATLLTLDELPQRLDEMPKDRTIVFVCRSGQRSAHAAAFARENGLVEVYNMAGGMLRWNELGLTTERGN